MKGTSSEVDPCSEPSPAPHDLHLQVHMPLVHQMFQAVLGVMMMLPGWGLGSMALLLLQVRQKAADVWDTTLTCSPAWELMYVQFTG